jgi:hypothetical protein
MPSASQVRKAITSWRVSLSIASIRARSASFIAASIGAPRALMVAAASAGITPIAAIASQARASISNQMRKRLVGAQIASICGLV